MENRNEPVTKQDLQILRFQIIDDLKIMMEKENNQVDKEPVWIRSKAARKILDNISPASLQNLRIAGKLHPKKVGGSWYYNRNEIDDLFSGKGD